MSRWQRILGAGLLAGAAVLLLAGPCAAQYRRYRPPAGRPIHPPGWDWWRIYPWSPYNYGRNPYNPAWVPYGYPSPYPYTNYYPPPYYPGYASGPGPSYYSGGTPTPSVNMMSIPGASYTYGAADAERQVLVPDPSGPVRTAPLDAAVIRMYVPEPNAQVWFNGVKSSSLGTTRYYVTPELPQGKPYHYEIKASWERDGKLVTEERAVTVRNGKTTVVDFDKPERKGL
jgi:uncharacterized protein (TIGR03000 family)